MQEKVLAECRMHWSAFIAPGIIALFFYFGAIDFVVNDSGTLDSIIAFLIFGTIPLVYAWIKRKTTYIRLTETKIIGHVGVLKSKTLSAPLHVLQHISYENGLLGKILGYHTIKIATAGTGVNEFCFKHMEKAVEFAEAVQSRIK